MHIDDFKKAINSYQQCFMMMNVRDNFVHYSHLFNCLDSAFVACMNFLSDTKYRTNLNWTSPFRHMVFMH